jgi:hypothetical protein
MTEKLKHLPKIPKLKHFKIKKSTDPGTAVLSNTAVPASAPSGDGSLEIANKAESSMNQFRDENSGTGAGVFEYLASQG